MEKISIMGVNFSKVTMDEAIDITFNNFFNQDKMKMIFTPNPEFLLRIKDDNEFLKILNEGDMVLPDGIGIIYASKILGKSIKSRVGGCDFTEEVIKRGASQNKKVYILGGKPKVAEKAANNLMKKYKGIQIVGYHDGYFNGKEEIKIVEEISKLSPDYLIVSLGCPKQEKFIYKYRDKLNVKVAIGNGGAIDIYAETVERAPIFYQKIGMEWFYRLVKEPKRIKRIIKLPIFIFDVIKEKFNN